MYHSVSSIEGSVANRDADSTLSEDGLWWKPWWRAVKKAGLLYLLMHVVFLLLTLFALLFTLNAHHLSTTPHAFLYSWSRWDTGHYVGIIVRGYDNTKAVAFFPLFPILGWLVHRIIPDPFVSALLVSNIADLGMMIVLYRLVERDWDADRALRTVFYLGVFPTAFFLSAAYNESLCLFCALLCIYFLRSRRWWLAGLCGFFTVLTRSTGLMLMVPFLYEYARQREWNWRRVDWHVLSMILLPLALGLYMYFCYRHYGDPLAFSKSQRRWWGHIFTVPLYGPIAALIYIFQQGVLNLYSIHSLLDLSTVTFVVVLLVLSFVGPWRLPRTHWCYPLYGAMVLLFVLCNPIIGLTTPMSSDGRYMLEVFPAFILLAGIGRHRYVHYSYLLIGFSLLSCLLVLFTSGGWIV